MANPDIPRGLVPVRHRNGAPYNGAANIYYVPSTYGTALYVGDPVVLVTASADAQGIQTVGIATAGAGAGNIILGPIVSLAFGGDPAIPVLRDSKRYHAANTAGYVLVADNPELVFEVQEDGVGGAMGVGCVGRNVDLIAGSGSTVTGWSGWQLDSNTLGTGATVQMRIVGPVIRPDNDPTLTKAKWLVTVNHDNHELNYTTGI
jgi:hypothetical protein